MTCRGVPVLAGLLAIALTGCSGATGGGPSSGDTSSAPPSASAAVSPSAVPSPSPSPVPTFKPLALKGSSDRIAKFSIPDGSAAVAVISGRASGNFAVESLASDGSTNDLLVNTIGRYSGTVLFDEQDGQHSVAFKITSDGSWTITVEPVTSAPRWDAAKATKGTGDAVLVVSPPSSGLAAFDITHNGSSNFAVTAYSGAGGDLLVNEIGHYAGQQALPDGTFLVTITADGAWTLTPST